MNEPKPGNLTTEYKMTLAMALATVLVSIGVIAEADKDMVVTVVLALLPLAAVIWKYIESRTRVKEAAATITTIELPEIALTVEDDDSAGLINIPPKSERKYEPSYSPTHFGETR